MRFVHYVLALVWATLTGAVTQAHAADLTLAIEPRTTTIPDAVNVELDGVASDFAPFPPSGLVYTAALSLPANTWVQKPVLSVRWGATTQSLGLRLTQQSPATIKLILFNYKYSPDKGSLDAIDRGSTPIFMRYFVARDIYYQLGATKNEVRYRALKIWYDAAYNLALGHRYIAIDREVIDTAQHAEDDAKSDSQLTSILKRLNGAPDYFTRMNRQFVALDFRDVALVGDLVNSGHIAAATLVNTHYLNALQSLPEGSRNDLGKTLGVTLEQLTKNGAFLTTLGQTRKDTVATFPSGRTS